MRASKAQGWSDPWTVARLDLLKKLWAEGYSASQVAGQLGGGISRAAVCGKANRLGLVHGATVVRKPRSDRGANYRPRKPRAAGGADRHRQPPQLSVVGAPVDDGPPPPVPPLHIELYALEPQHCRWPFGDGPFTFCGHLKAGESPYCAHHRMIRRAKR